MSELSAQIEHFLVYREKLNHREGYHIALASAYRRRGLEGIFDRACTQRVWIGINNPATQSILTPRLPLNSNCTGTLAQGAGRRP